MAPRSEGMNLSPVEFAVPMSEQTQTTAGHGSDILGPVIIEGSPEAPQTVAIPAPITSQIVSDTVAEPDVSLEVADVETDEQTETPNTTIVLLALWFSPFPTVLLSRCLSHANTDSPARAPVEASDDRKKSLALCILSNYCRLSIAHAFSFTAFGDCGVSWWQVCMCQVHTMSY